MLDNSSNLEQPKPKLGLQSLQAVLDFLKENNFNVAIKDINTAKTYLIELGSSLPLVRDGADGIRAEYDEGNDKLTIWFTNGFADPKNEQRQKVQAWIDENFSRD